MQRYLLEWLEAQGGVVQVSGDQDFANRFRVANGFKADVEVLAVFHELLEDRLVHVGRVNGTCQQVALVTLPRSMPAAQESVDQGVAP